MTSAILDAPSHAHNFPNFFKSGVDPRTGTFSSNISLCSLMANALTGPSCPVALVFSPLQGVDMGFGIGWSIPCSRYSPSTRRLNLVSGASYEALMTADSFQVLDQKVRSIKTRRNGDELVIEHKSGQMEILTNPGENWPEWLVTKIYSPQGRMIRLEYTVHRGKQCLHEIWDEHQRVLLVELNEGSSPAITAWPDQPQNALRFQLRLRNSELSSIALNAGTQTAIQWAFTYTRLNTLLLMSELRLPTGGVERVTYGADVLQLPEGAPLRALPAVMSHSVFPGAGQPPIVRTFNYSLKNYLGYGSNIRWKSGEDNLYLALGEFEYSSVEVLVTGYGSRRRPVKQITRTYNRFHLLVSEITNQNGHLISKRIQYNDKAGLGYHLQPGNFQLPWRTSTEYSLISDPANSRVEETLTEFDEQGNLLKQVLPTGVVELMDYYPPEGAAGCPADPFGSVRWIKSKTVIPAGSSADVSAESLVTLYQYVDLPSATPARPRYIALHQQKHCVSTVDGASTPFKAITHQYVSEAGSRFFGRLSQTLETVNGVDCRYEYRYQVIDGQLETRTTFSSMGVQSQQSQRQEFCFGGQTRMEDRCGTAVDIMYDRLGRKLAESVAGGTSNQCSITHGYHLPVSEMVAQKTVTTDSIGREVTTTIDGLGRKVAIEAQDLDHPGKPLRKLYAATYNDLGQLVREEHTDWTQDQPRALVTAYEYDDWGNQCATLGPDGVRMLDRTDPISLVHTTGKDGAGKTVANKNLFGKDDGIARHDQKGAVVSTRSNRYDGLGRCVEMIDPQGNQTRYTYDFANRVVSVLLPDQTLIRKTYAAHSLQDMPTQIWVNDYLAGERSYDGLMRITEVTVGGRRERFTYDGAQTQPTTHTKASGLVTRWQYDLSLNSQPLSREVDGHPQLNCAYRYDAGHAGLIQAAAPSRLLQKQYSPSGRLKQDDTVNDAVERHATHGFSMRGECVEYVDPAGVSQRTRYDEHGRAASVEQGGVDARLTYDAQGRLSRSVVRNATTGVQMATALEYDDFDREVRRLLAVDDGPEDELVQHFDPCDRLQQRTLNRAGQTLLDERYDYDVRGRLSQYQCSGAALPKDSIGKSIRSQVYEFDAMDNITRVTTVFDGGENITSYRYDRPDKTQLSALTHSHRDYTHQNTTFDYDADGNQLNDQASRGLIYDALGRLTAVTEKQP
ncbi:RHS repeat domain-containing protein [Pseudomonas huanghezhanensis]|uniref:hypothetical protein n=1 Tax=Pseudomonas huanghezhanensis TaxID=3002903 RepID=UPI002285C6B2|nr:hypothetical protein [Pseudomonas sp. BSw22131]